MTVETRKTERAAPEVEAIFSSPALLAEEHVESALGLLERAIKSEGWPSTAQAASADFWDFEPDSFLARLRPYVVREGVLTIPVKGVLLNGFPYQFMSLVTGYEYIRAAFERGQDDQEVSGIALLIDSPGGAAAGAFELVDRMVSTKRKPLKTVVQHLALSAGYAIATAGDEIITTESGKTGSVGVVVRHVDASKALEKAGYKVTFVQAGAHKTDFNPFEPLSDEARSRLKKSVDKLHARFAASVASNRGMDEGAVRDTEALVFDADESIEVGFSDRIADPEDELSAFSAELGTRQERVQMSTKQTPAAETPTITTADIDAARTEGTASGSSSERARFAAVLASEHYAGREAMAQKLLSTTDLGAEEIVGVLESAPKPAATSEKAPATKGQNSHFDAAMVEASPGMGGADAEAETEAEDTPSACAARIRQSYRLATGTPDKQ